MENTVPLQHPEEPLKCNFHPRNCTLIGYDKNCTANCMLCLDCIDDAQYKTHKKDDINHKTINMHNIEQSFQTLRSKNSKEIRRNKDNIDQHFKRVEAELMQKLKEAKDKLYHLSDIIMLTEITQDIDKLAILQTLFLKKFSQLKCSDISLIAKDLMNLKPGAISVGYQQFNNFLSEQLPNVNINVDIYTKQQKYKEIVLDNSRIDIDYPRFHRPKPPTPPSPPQPKKVVKKQSPPPRKYIKPFSLIDVKEFRGLGMKKIQFGDSKVMSKQQSSQLMNHFNKFNVKSIDLLYRASENNFSVPKFHQLCDNHTNTIVILRTEFGKIIGGYTPLPWKSTTGTMHSDTSKQSFLFSISLKQKMDLIDVKCAIFNYSLYGPCFGAGSDLAIFPQADSEPNSYSDFPYSYNNSFNHENHQQTTTFFTGQPKGKNFLIKQWEVWKLRLV